jgi:protein dpy-30
MKKESREVSKDQKYNNQNSNASNLPIRAYLDQTVVPLLLQGLAELAKERPDNPIEHLANFLLKHSNENTK